MEGALKFEAVQSEVCVSPGHEVLAAPAESDDQRRLRGAGKGPALQTPDWSG